MPSAITRPVVDDEDAFRHRVGLLEVMGREEDRRSVLLAQPNEVLPQVCPALRIEPGRRLVEEQQARRVDHADRDVEPPPLATRECARLPAGERAELERLEQLVRPGRRVITGHAVAPALGDDLVADLLVVGGTVALAHVADPLPHGARIRHDIEARHCRRSRRRCQQGREHPQAGRLAGAIRPEEGHQLPSIDVEIEPADRLDCFLSDSEIPGQAFCVDHRSPPLAVVCLVYQRLCSIADSYLAAIRAKVRSMANTSTRMLRLLSLLQTHRYWTGSELAERLEVSERTVRRDVDRLRELGYPVDANRGVAGGYQLEAGGALPPLLLDDDEAIAIAVGLRQATGGSVRGIEETSVRALTKIIRMMPPGLRRRMDALGDYTVPALLGGGPSVDADALTIIAQACRDDERLRFGYTGRDGAQAIRLVEPNRLVTVGRRWYLVGWDVDRADWRTFRVDRLTDPRSTRFRFQPREVPGGDAAAFVSQGLASVPTRYQVIVAIQTPAANVEPVVGAWGAIESVDARSCRLQMNVDSLDWPAMVLAAVGAEFEIVNPPELRDYIRRLGEFFARAG